VAYGAPEMWYLCRNHLNGILWTKRIVCQFIRNSSLSHTITTEMFSLQVANVWVRAKRSCCKLRLDILRSAGTMLWQCHGQLSKPVAPVGLIRSWTNIWKTAPMILKSSIFWNTTAEAS
jgi:hypothetical protein